MREYFFYTLVSHMIHSPFVPEQLSSVDSSTENELKKWLRNIAVDERVEFIKRLWPTNYILALRLVRSCQIPLGDVESLLKHWLTLGHHNAAQRLLSELEPLLGEKKFWKVVSETPLSEVMQQFINYHGNGRLDAIKHG